MEEKYLRTQYLIIYCTQKACFIHQTPREDINGNKVLLHNEKYFLVDHGFYQADMVILKIWSLYLKILFIWNYSEDDIILMGIINKKEIDFVCTKDKEKKYVQVTYLLEMMKQ